VRLRDIAQIQAGTMSGQYDRYNMKRQVTLTANRAHIDLGRLMHEVDAAIQRAGPPPQGTQIEVRGQMLPLREMASSLTAGLAIALGSVCLLLTAYFQSMRLAVAAMGSVPAVVAGVGAMLWLTGSTLNVQSFIGAIMAVGVAMANAILLVTFAQRYRHEGLAADEAARRAAAGRLRAILMTSSAMIGGMLPMALGLGEVGQQNAPLGRAVIGGLGGGTLATLLALPSAIAWLFRGRVARSASLDPDDPDSPYYTPGSEADEPAAEA
jgi:multidrug efflux pump subunit AcrB